MSTTTLPSTVKSITFDRAIGKLVLFGDSITQRSYSLDEGRYDLTGPLVDNKRQSFIFGSALTDLFRRRLDVVPRGYSGYCSEHARYIVDDVIAGIGSGIKLVTIFFGSNDASKDPNQCVPIARYSDNIKYVIERFQAVGAKVILVGPAPLKNWLVHLTFPLSIFGTHFFIVLDGRKGNPSLESLRRIVAMPILIVASSIC